MIQRVVNNASSGKFHGFEEKWKNGGRDVREREQSKTGLLAPSEFYSNGRVFDEAENLGIYDQRLFFPLIKCSQKVSGWISQNKIAEGVRSVDVFDFPS